MSKTFENAHCVICTKSKECSVYKKMQETAIVFTCRDFDMKNMVPLDEVETILEDCYNDDKNTRLWDLFSKLKTKYGVKDV